MSLLQRGQWLQRTNPKYHRIFFRDQLIILCDSAIKMDTVGFGVLNLSVKISQRDSKVTRISEYRLRVERFDYKVCLYSKGSLEK